jgi:hypothetical protein
MWSVPPLWKDETAFIIGGGPSVSIEPVHRLKGRRVIVINSSYTAAPWADFLVFTDARWWTKHRQRVKHVFEGEVVTIKPTRGQGFDHVCERQRSGGLSPNPRYLVCFHTTMTTAINLAVHLGVRGIGILGLDGQDAPDGRKWHHEPHPSGWLVNPRRYEHHATALAGLVEPLKALGVRTYVTNPESACTTFPHKPLADLLEGNGC